MYIKYLFDEFHMHTCIFKRFGVIWALSRESLSSVVSGLVLPKPACSATQISKKTEILLVVCLDMIISIK